MSPCGTSCCWPRTNGEEGGNESDLAEGIIIVYVDDLLIAAIAALARTVSQMLREQWKCSSPEWVSEAGEVKFNGFEIRALEGGLELHQNSYVKDLLERRQAIEGFEDVPAPPAAKFTSAAVDHYEDEDFSKVKEAQAIAGELQWLCGRCRPELTYGVNLMAQAISKAPGSAFSGSTRLEGSSTPRRFRLSLALGLPVRHRFWRASLMPALRRMGRDPSKPSRFTWTVPLSHGAVAVKRL